MTPDPIVDELHRLRAEEMKRLDYDFDAFCDRLREQEKLEKKVLSPPAADSRDSERHSTWLQRRADSLS